MVGPARLLDLDGTLVLSYPLYAKAIATAGSAAEASVLAALHDGQNVVALMRASGVTPAAMRWALDRTEVPSVAGWDVTLAELRRRRHPLGIVTSLPVWLAQALLLRAALEPAVDVVIANARKPSPAGIIKALAVLGTTPSEADLYVGDTPIDGEAARRAGISFAWASWGYGPPQEPALERPEDLLG
jgi:phosphoglycolate phosphatase-like HAD superfamily hydrolase